MGRKRAEIDALGEKLEAASKRYLDAVASAVVVTVVPATADNASATASSTNTTSQMLTVQAEKQKNAVEGVQRTYQSAVQELKTFVDKNSAAFDPAERVMAAALERKHDLLSRDPNADVRSAMLPIWIKTAKTEPDPKVQASCREAYETVAYGQSAAGLSMTRQSTRRELNKQADSDAPLSKTILRDHATASINLQMAKLQESPNNQGLYLTTKEAVTQLTESVSNKMTVNKAGTHFDPVLDAIYKEELKVLRGVDTKPAALASSIMQKASFTQMKYDAVDMALADPRGYEAILKKSLGDNYEVKFLGGENNKLFKIIQGDTIVLLKLSRLDDPFYQKEMDYLSNNDKLRSHDEFSQTYHVANFPQDGLDPVQIELSEFVEADNLLVHFQKIAAAIPAASAENSVVDRVAELKYQSSCLEAMDQVMEGTLSRRADHLHLSDEKAQNILLTKNGEMIISDKKSAIVTSKHSIEEVVRSDGKQHDPPTTLAKYVVDPVATTDMCTANMTLQLLCAGDPATAPMIQKIITPPTEDQLKSKDPIVAKAASIVAYEAKAVANLEALQAPQWNNRMLQNGFGVAIVDVCRQLAAGDISLQEAKTVFQDTRVLIDSKIVDIQARAVAKNMMGAAEDNFDDAVTDSVDNKATTAPRARSSVNVDDDGSPNVSRASSTNSLSAFTDKAEMLRDKLKNNNVTNDNTNDVQSVATQSRK